MIKVYFPEALFLDGSAQNNLSIPINWLGLLNIQHIKGCCPLTKMGETWNANASCTLVQKLFITSILFYTVERRYFYWFLFGSNHKTWWFYCIQTKKSILCSYAYIFSCSKPSLLNVWSWRPNDTKQSFMESRFCMKKSSFFRRF